MRRTKIIATIGPSSESNDALTALVEAGIDVARLNASHSTVDELDRRLRDIRRVASSAGRTVAALLDLPGPKLRLGVFEPLRVESGAEVILTADEGPADPRAARGAAPDSATVPCPECALLASAVSAGDTLAIGDGDVELLVTEASGGRITTRVTSGGPVLSRRGITARGVKLPVGPLTPADREYLSWGLEAGVDMVAQSFVREASDVESLRRLIADTDIPIIAKIEQPEAVADIDAIVREADAVMVARGDLGVATSPESVPVFQKRVVAAARAQGRPVIVATQMLESMIVSPQPTRAEASDVANAVFDSADAVMLSAETAVGAHAVESVAVMSRILTLAEEYQAVALTVPRPHSSDDVPWAVSASVAQLARDLDLAAIVTATESGATARFVAAHRPAIPIVAVTPSELVARRLALVWGVTPVVAPPPQDMDDLIRIAASAARDAGYSTDSLIAITAGIDINRPGTTDFVHVRRID